MPRRKSSLSEVIRCRQVIPRWNSADAAAALGQRSTPKRVAISARAEKSLRAARQDFERCKSEAAATEYLQTARMLGVEEDVFARNLEASFPRLSKAADRIALLSDSENAIASSAQIGQRIADHRIVDHREIAAQRVHQLRRVLATASDRPLSWSELARQFLILGEEKKARRAMHAALKLAPSNVYLTRCAVRLLTHLDEHATAAKLLQRDGGATHNPWLMAADVAIAASMGKTSRNMKRALDILALNRDNVYQLSELASAVGTVELDRGSRKHGKELIRRSLIAPTENSLAQAQWCVSNGESLAIPDTAWNVPSSHEALAFAAHSAVDFQSMVDACVAWFAEEPFSSRPGALASTACFVPNLRAISMALATAALRYAPDSVQLLNNRAVCLAYAGDPSAAFSDIITAINTPEFGSHGVALATLGLIGYRSGDQSLGSDCYRKSVTLFKHVGDVESALRASVHWALEEARYDREAGDKLFSDVRDRCRRVDRTRFPELHAIVDLADQTIGTDGVLQDLRIGLDVTKGGLLPAREQLMHAENQMLKQISASLVSETTTSIVIDDAGAIHRRQAPALAGGFVSSTSNHVATDPDPNRNRSRARNLAR